MIINLNDRARIKLRPKGERIILEYWKVGGIKTLEDIPTFQYGSVTMQLWEVMEIFGGAISLSCDPPFETSIEIIPS